MLEKQRGEDGDAYVFTILFNEHSVVIHDRVDIKKVKPMTKKQYQVGGCTALLDAVGGATGIDEDWVVKYRCNEQGTVLNSQGKHVRSAFCVRLFASIPRLILLYYTYTKPKGGPHGITSRR